MKKSLLALAVLGAFSGVASAQSSVVIYGVVDSAVRLVTNQGTTAANKDDSITSLIPGGMAGSRLGFNINEDLGGGLRAIANFEHRFASDNGTNSGTSATFGTNDFWRQSWVGLQSESFGRVTMGRQYNVLFDAYTTTYASFGYSPYIEAFKPESGYMLGARNDNMVKYAITVGGFTGEAQVSAGEGVATGFGANGKSMGAMLKYSIAGFSVAGAYLELEDTASGKNVEAMTLGGSYRSGPLYINASWGRNDFETGFNPTLNVLYGASNGSAVRSNNAALPATARAAAASTRDLFSTGVTYQVTPALNLGGQYWRFDQDGVNPTTGAANQFADGKGDAFAFVANYGFSKRTFAYFEVDHTKIGGNLEFSNGTTDRTGVMVGLRHNF